MFISDSDVFLRFDDEEPSSKRSVGEHRFLDIVSPLYIGGSPSLIRHQKSTIYFMNVHQGLLGCIYNMKIGLENVDLVSILLVFCNGKC